MARAYGIDLRDRVISSIEEGTGYEEAADIFKIAVSTVKRWFYQYRDAGHVRPKTGYQKGHSHKLTDDAEFIAIVQSNPSQTSLELAERIGDVASSTVRRKLKKLGYSRKKRISLR